MEKNKFEKLEIWKLAVEIVKEVYKISNRLPKDERYGLTLQLKRAVTSVPLNIAEGSTRGFDKVFIQFLYQARGSLIEVKTILFICVEIQLIQVGEINELFKKIEVCHKKINALIKFLRSTVNSPQSTVNE